MRGRWALAALAWLGVVAAATTAGVAVVGSLGQGILGRDAAPLRPDEVLTRLSAGATPRPGSSASPMSTPGSSAPASSGAGSPVAQVLAIRGGTVVASCVDGQVSLLTWTPAQGYQADHVVRGPAAVASIRFKAHDDGDDVRVEVVCVAGEPRAHPASDD